jgi:hypothetical protein
MIDVRRTPSHHPAGTSAAARGRHGQLPDLNTADLDAAERIVAGTARSTGVEDQEKDETYLHPTAKQQAGLSVASGSPSWATRPRLVRARRLHARAD